MAVYLKHSPRRPWEGQRLARRPFHVDCVDWLLCLHRGKQLLRVNSRTVHGPVLDSRARPCCLAVSSTCHVRTSPFAEGHGPGSGRGPTEASSVVGLGLGAGQGGSRVVQGGGGGLRGERRARLAVAVGPWGQRPSGAAPASGSRHGLTLLQCPQESPFWGPSPPGDQAREIRGSGGRAHCLAGPPISYFSLFPDSREGQVDSESGNHCPGWPSTGPGVKLALGPHPP